MTCDVRCGRGSGAGPGAGWAGVADRGAEVVLPAPGLDRRSC